MLKSLAIIPLTMLSACATLVNGSSQNVTVATDPPGATCILDRIGARLGVIPATPGSLRVDKSKHDLSVTCDMDGYQTATVSQPPKFSAATFGNIIAGGVVGVDAASGANYRYPENISLAMVTNPRPSLPPVASQHPGNAPGMPIRLTPVVTQPDAQPTRIGPTKRFATPGANTRDTYPP